MSCGATNRRRTSASSDTKQVTASRATGSQFGITHLNTRRLRWWWHLWLPARRLSRARSVLRNSLPCHLTGRAALPCRNRSRSLLRHLWLSLWLLLRLGRLLGRCRLWLRCLHCLLHTRPEQQRRHRPWSRIGQCGTHVCRSNRQFVTVASMPVAVGLFAAPDGLWRVHSDRLRQGRDVAAASRRDLRAAPKQR